MTHRFCLAPAALVVDIRQKPTGLLDNFVWVEVSAKGKTTFHALGHKDGHPCITSPLTGVDPATHRVRTASGHVYEAGYEAEAPDLHLLGHLNVALASWGVVEE